MSQKTLYLHVGMDKTGTSAIQYFLYHNKESLLRDASLCYPETGLYKDFSHHPFAFSVIKWYGYTRDNLYQLFHALVTEVGEAENVLLSSECLFKIPLNEEFKALHSLINDHFDNVKVLVYVRRQDEWVESRHKHSVISGNELSLEMLMQPQFCDYKQFIDCWANIFNRNNIIVRAYEKQQFSGGSIFSDFISMFDLKLSDDYKVPPAKINVSLGNNELDFKKLCNKIGFLSDGVDTLNEILLMHSSRSGLLESENTRYLLSPLDRVNLVNRYSDINSSIAKEYLGRKAGSLFYDEKPDLIQDWNRNPGISDQAITNIGRYIYQEAPDLMTILKSKIDAAVKSTDNNIATSGKILRQVMDNCILAGNEE